jgi:ribosome-binding factor A
MGKGHSKAPSQRQLRVGEEVRHMLAWILERGEIHDPGLAGVVVTITEVRISPDLRNATAYVMPLGGVDIPVVLEAINRAAPFLRRLLGRKIKLKRLPNLYFEADQSFKEAEHIDNLLKTPIVARDLESDNINTKEGNGGDGA